MPFWMPKGKGIEIDDFDNISDSGWSDDVDAEDIVGHASTIRASTILGHQRRRSEEDAETYLPDVQMRDTEDPFKHTELVLKFNPKVRTSALRWFIHKLTAKKSEGGAELMVKREPYYGDTKEGLVIHVTAQGWRLLEIAEKLEIVKRDYTRHIMRPFKLIELNDFLKDATGMSEILTPAEKQIAVMHELQHVYVQPGEDLVPGYSHMELTARQSIFHAFLHHQLIVSYFALHNPDDLSNLEGEWLKSFWDKNPYEGIRAYFGDNTCLYFNFLQYYTLFLILPALIGLGMMIVPEHWYNKLVFGVCIINMVHVTVYLIMWQRFQSQLAFRWGTLKMVNWEPARENHKGVLGHDPVTGRVERLYPHSYVMMKTYLVSCPIVFICCGLTIGCMFLNLDMDAKANEYVNKKLQKNLGFWQKTFWTYIYRNSVGVAYAVLIIIFTKVYRWLSEILTEWENHRTESQFERHLVYKMVIFEIANGFSLLLYTAFYLKDIELLKKRLLILFVVSQFVLMAQIGVPLIFRTGKESIQTILELNRQLVDYVARDLITKTPSQIRKSVQFPGLEGLPIETMDPRDNRVQISKIEENMAPYKYEEDFNEYLYIYMQFGYMFLFASVFPLAGTLAIGSNLILLASSLYKRSEVYQRALARRVKNIGAWQDAFDLTGTFAVVTNCALITINESLQNEFPNLTRFEFFAIFVIIEHVILVIQFVVKRVVPKIPNRIKLALAKDQFQSSLALKREKATDTRKRLAQVFQPRSAPKSSRPKQ